jgi:hypothetical protein
MITKIIQIVQSEDWYGISKNVEFAKGSDKIATNWGELRKKIKRAYRWLKK